MNPTNRGSMTTRVWTIAAVLGALSLSACEVTNPGPVNDEFLTLPESQAGFVNGAQERLVEAATYLAYGSAYVSRELFPGGTPEGAALGVLAGSLLWNDAGLSNAYPRIQQARWVSEESIRRFKVLGNVTPALMFQASIWAGYANRMLGENWCESVIDGGPLEPGSKYFERAQQHFTDALAVAPAANDRYKALAGRAQVKMWLKDWSGAAADAALVPDAFNFYAEVDFSGLVGQRNQIYYATSGTPYRSATVRFTYFDQYYTDTGDPRTPWIDFPNVVDRLCVGSLQGYGRVPCTYQQKYPEEGSDFRLAGGREMRLIEAEALLVAGNFTAAMAKINGVRTSQISKKTGQPLAPWTATNLTDAWTMLKRERAIELWLEARRMGDQRRWADGNTPGSIDLPNFEAQSTFFTQNPRGREAVQGQPTPRLLCYNISDTERNTNPNIPDVAG
jgi:starch-binding outer membrane protein, SusD/RagB family